MAEDFYTGLYNPDVLSCLANLSSDEVFTPPDIANQMLDLIPQELFQSPESKFLDPACKSGIFLREIAKRLLKGLEPLIPDLQQRIDHIFHHQLYGITITELTSLLSRRGVYCSKYPNSIYSVTPFDDAQGNIRFKLIQHNWKNGNCVFCGASRSKYDRQDFLETHAYELIHTTKPEEIFKMKFDVIISNPPYQLSTSGSVESQATPIYNKFIDQAKKLNPRYLSMITPARWLNGGFGLDQFRKEMLNDNRLRVIHDFIDSRDCFNGVSIKGGVCFFLWDRDNPGPCKVYTHSSNKEVVFSERELLEEGVNTFIRFNEAISILHKVQSKKEDSFSEIVSPRDPFGLNYYENKREIMFKKFSDKPFPGCVEIYYQGWLKEGIKYIDKKYISTRFEQLNKYKVFISKAYGANESYPHQILNKPFIGRPNTCCNMTYLTIGTFENFGQAKNVVSYIQTKFFRFMVSLLKNTQNAYKKVYALVPMQDFSKHWLDEELYGKYNLTDEEIAFIESMIRPMELGDDYGE